MRAIDSPVRRFRLIKKFASLLIVFLLLMLSLFFFGITVYLIAPPPPITLLLVGWDHSVPPQSDGVILLHVRPKTFQISQFALPSEIMLYTGDVLQLIREFDDSISLANALTQQLNIEIDTTIELNYESTETLINAVNGVPIYIPRVIEDSRFPIDGEYEVQRVWFNSGLQSLSGEQVLNYARTVQVDGTISRANRLSDIIAGFGEKLSSPRYWLSLLQAVGQIQSVEINVGDVVALFPSLVLSQGRFEVWEFSEADFRRLSDTEKTLVSEGFELWLEENFRG